MLTTCLIFLTTFLVIKALWQRRILPKGWQYPPGPTPWPIVGNIPHLLFAGGQPHEALHKLAKKYGDVMLLQFGPTYSSIIVSDLEAAKEFFVKNGRYTSDRKIHSLLAKAFTVQGSIIWQNDKEWGLHRHLVKSSCRKLDKVSSGIEVAVRREVHNMRCYIDRHLGKPLDVRDMVINAAASIIVTIASREDLDDEANRKEFEDFLRAMDCVSKGFNSSNLAMLLPILYDSFFYSSLRNNVRKMINYSKHLVRNELVSEVGSTNNIINTYLQHTRDDSEVLSQEDIWRAIFDLLSAGTETTGYSIMWGILFVCRYPEVQRKIQSEIDLVIQGNSAITYKTKENLPYTHAFILELLRYSNIAPLGVPRVTSQSFTANGYYVPAGTEIWLNEYAVHHDEKRWKDPFSFEPERFLLPNGTMDWTKARKLVSFGLGRRKCIGKDIADVEIFLILVNLLQRYKFSVPDPTKMPSLIGEFGLTYSPPSFQVVINSSTAT